MASVLIAGLSLVVSSYVLWATRLRPARLSLAAEPGSYRTIFDANRLRLRLPLAIANDGARNGVVTGLRLRLPDQWNANEEHAFAHRTYVSMDRDDERRFFEPISIAGGSIELSISEFHVHGVDTASITTGTYILYLEYPRAESAAVVWEPMGSLAIRVTDVEIHGFDRPMTHFNGFRS